MSADPTGRETLARDPSWEVRILEATKSYRHWAQLPDAPRMDRAMKESGFRDLVRERDEAVARVRLYISEVEIAVARAQQAEVVVERRNGEVGTWMREYRAAEARVADLREALRGLVAAVEPLMESKPTEITAEGLLRYDWTEALYALKEAIGPARAALETGQ